MLRRIKWFQIGILCIGLTFMWCAARRTIAAQAMPVLAGEAHPELVLRNGHVKEVRALAFSPDGRFLASAGQDKTAKVWDVHAGTLRYALTGHQGPVLAVAFSGDGQILYTGSADGTVRAWSTATGRFFGTLFDARKPLTSIAVWLGPPGKQSMRIADSDAANTVTLWNSKNGPEQPGEIVAALKGHEKPVRALAFSPDGKWLVSGDDGGSIKEWDTEDGALQRTLRSHALPIRSIAFSQDGQMFADASYDGISQIWETETGKRGEELQLNTPEEGVEAVAFSVHGITATGGHGGRSHNEYIKLWDAKTGKELHVLKGGHEASVSAVAFSPNGKLLASGSRDNTIRLWDAQTGNPKGQLGESDRILAVAFSPKAEILASGSADGSARIWNTRTGELLHALLGHSDLIHCVAFSPDGTILATGSRDKTIRFWNAQTGTLLATLPVERPVLSLTFSSDGTVLASGHGSSNFDGMIRTWNAATHAPLLTLDKEALGQVYSVAFSPDGSVLASGSSDGQLRFWNAKTGEKTNAVFFGEGGETKTPDFAFPIYSLAFSSDGKTLVAGSANFDAKHPTDHIAVGDSIKVLNGKTLAFQSKLAVESPDGQTNALAFLPDKKSVVSASGDGSVRIWKIRTEEAPQTLKGHSGDVLAVAVSPDGSRIASAGIDNTIRIWNTASGRMRATLLPLPAREKENSRTEWLATTPAGYYDGSVGAGRFIEWRVGPDLFPMEAYEPSFHRPDLVRRALEDQPAPNLPEAHRFATGESVPPEIFFIDLKDGDQITGSMLHVKGIVTEKPEKKIAVRLMVNGRPIQGKLIALGAKPIALGAKLIALGAKPIALGAKPIALGAKPIALGAKPIALGAKPIPAEHKFCQEFEADVPLPSGGDSILLTAEAYDADHLQARSEIRLVRGDVVTSKAGTLYVLSVGVSKYRNPNFNLRYAGRDANTFADLWQRKGGALYQNVVVTRLLDEQATTANVRAALFKLLETAKEQDSVALFLSGHGVQTNDREYYFATHDIDPATAARLSETALPWTAFETTLATVRAHRIFLFLDACHSGNALGDMQAYNERLAEPLVKRAGVLVFASSRGSEYSYEVDAAQHGAFTEAIVEGLDQGKADFEVNGVRDGVVTAEELLAYLRVRVPQLTGNRQTPSCPLLRDFGEAFPLAKTK